ncbi:hypothetical protein EWM64_g10499 [Hericium alpestre]|uniref:Uncharacterized protein n=1 Tax=Hericium alpestre TaxID=135208 RepID=A0A4Y9ZG03_9AGAM|nr:hypothetical protein EWM64_g10499 [Hericium alpestre]
MIRVGARWPQYPNESVADILRWLLQRGITYHMLTQALLARPHARHWILRGSLAWGLALHYGPSHLLQDAVSGPSSTVLVEGRGGEYDIPYASVGDLPSAAENAALIGQTRHGSFWPSLTLWEQSVAYTGEWHPSLERWFQHRVAELAAGTDLYLSDRAWFRHIRRAVHSTERALGSTVGSAHRARELIGVYPECSVVSLLFFPSTAPASASFQV